jgi:putative ABC transport system permease protein
VTDVLQDLRFAMRFWRKRPLSVMAAVITLALGAGANTAIFSVIYAVLIRPLPYQEPQRLVQIWRVERAESAMPSAAAGQNRFTDTSLLEYWQRQASTVDVAGYAGWMTTAGSGGDPERVFAGLVTAEFFPMLGVSPITGRSFSKEEMTPGQDQVVMLSDGYWRRRFGGDRAILGRSILLDQIPHNVVGILPPGYRSYAAGLREDLDLFAPISRRLDSVLRNAPAIAVIGRLRDGASTQQAEQELQALAYSFAHSEGKPVRQYGVRLTPLKEQVFGQLRPALLLLFAASACLLLIACMNLANLTAAQMAGRTKELAVRSALGAGRGRLVRQILVECLAIAVPGGLLGILLASSLVRMLLVLYPGQLPRVEGFAWQPGVLAFTVASTLLSGLLFGLFPAWRFSGRNLEETLRPSGTVGLVAGRTARLWSALITGQVMATLVVLACAALLIRSLFELRSLDPGFRREGVLTAQIALPEQSYQTAASRAAFAQRLVERVRSLPGVHSAGVTNSMPLVFNLLMSVDVTIPGSEPGGQERIGCRTASPGYFEALGITMLAGRPFSPENESHGGVAIVNSSFARKYFGEAPPLGRQIHFGGKARTIIGVIRDLRNLRLQRPPEPELYVPFAAMPGPLVDLAVHAAAGPSALLAPIRAELRNIDGGLALGQVSTMEHNLERGVASWKFRAVLLAVFAGIAVALAAVGIYSVVACSVRLRTAEFGIRLALGARPVDLLRHVLRRGLAAPLIGTLLGVPLARQQGACWKACFSACGRSTV